MKKFTRILALAFLAVFVLSNAAMAQDHDKKKKSSSSSTYVKGHTRHTKSGKTTYVKGHYRKK